MSLTHARPAVRLAGLRLGALFGPAVFGVTAAGVALPAVIAALGADPATATWILTVHALALGVGTALFGRLADAVGTRAVLWSGSAIIAAGTLACLFAPGLGALVAGRAVLALGSGALAAGGLALGASTDPADRPRVLAVFGSVIAVFAAAATFAGGVATQALTWRIALVLPVLSVLAVPLCLPLAKGRRGGRSVDVVGALVLTVTATTALVLIQSRTLGLPLAVTAGCAVVLLAAAVVLVRRVVARPEGFVPRDVVADRRFLRAAAVGAGVYAGLFAAMYAVPQLLARDWTVLTVGASLLPGAVLAAVISRVAARPVVLAAVAVAAACVSAVAGLSGSAWGLVVGTSLATTAFATTQVVATARVSAAVAPDRRGAAMGLLNLCFFVGGAVGSAVTGALSGPLGLGGALAVASAAPLVAGALAVGLGRAGRN